MIGGPGGARPAPADPARADTPEDGAPATGPAAPGPDSTTTNLVTDPDTDPDTAPATDPDTDPDTGPVTDPGTDSATDFAAMPPAVVDVRDEIRDRSGHDAGDDTIDEPVDDPPADPFEDTREAPVDDAGVDPSPAEPYSTGNVPVLVPGGWDGARRRHRRQTLTFLGAFLLVLGLGVVAVLTYVGRIAWPFGGTVDLTQGTCTHSQPLPPKKIVLRVYNGSDRKGLAGQVAAQLEAFGFTVQETGNDPLEVKLRTPIEIRHGDSAELAALTTTAYLSGRVRDVRDDRLSDTVDVVLGPTFTHVHTRREVGKALAALTPRLPLTCPAGASPTPSAGTP